MLLLRVQGSCNEPFSCSFGNFTEISDCYGFYSCAYANQISSNDNINCDGSYACFGCTLIKNSNSDANNLASIECNGLKSCSNVSLIDANYANVNCKGELSCLNSIIQISGKGEFYCKSDRCGMNSVVIGGSIHHMDGHLSGYNTTFIDSGVTDPGTNMTQYLFYGHHSGYGATIICQDQNECLVECPGDSCKNLTLQCNGTCNFQIDCFGGIESNKTEFDITIPNSINFEMSRVDITDNFFDIYHNYNNSEDNIDHNTYCNDYEECNNEINGSMSWMESTLYCSGKRSCLFENVMIINSEKNDSIGIRCDGDVSCNTINTITISEENDASIYASGSFAMANVDIIGNIEGNMYCTGDHSCQNAIVSSIDNLFCHGSFSCEKSIITNTSNIWSNSRGGIEQSRINHIKENIYCLGHWACSFCSISNVHGTVYSVGSNNLKDSTLLNVSKVECIGYASCAYAVMINVQFIVSIFWDSLSNATVINNQSDLLLEMYDRSQILDVYCESENTCNITCHSSNSCSNMQLYCYSTCFVTCDADNGIECPTAMDNTNYITISVSTSDTPETTIENNNEDTIDNNDNDSTIYNIIINGFIIFIVVIVSTLIIFHCSKQALFLHKKFGKRKKKRSNATRNNCKNNNNNSKNDKNEKNGDKCGAEIDIVYDDNQIYISSPTADSIGHHGNGGETDSMNWDLTSMTQSIHIAHKFVMKTFCCNIYVYISLFTFLLCIFLGIICVLYGFGQITQLNLANYWCDKKDLSAIYAHSVEYNLNEGTNDGCWKSSQFTVDESSLFDTSIYSAAPDINTFNIITCMIWLIYATWFFIMAFGFISLYCTDCGYMWCKYVKSNDSTKQSMSNNTAKERQISSFHRCCPCCCCLPRNNKYLEYIGDIYWKYITWYRRYFGEDTRNWFFLLVLRELMEIMFQIFAIYNYNGVNLLNTSEIVLASKEFDIKLFTILLCGNCIMTGILWCFYIFKNTLCHGEFFKQLVFVMDTIFDTFYALFPIIVVTLNNNEFNINVAIGVLQTSSVTSFMSTFIPLSYLTIKCFFLFQKMRFRLRKNASNKLKKERRKLSNQHQLPVSSTLEPQIPTFLASMSSVEMMSDIVTPRQRANTEHTKKNDVNGTKLTAIDSASDNQSQLQSLPAMPHLPASNAANNYLYNPKHSRIAYLTVNIVLILVSIFFITFGIGFFMYVFWHFEQNNDICKNPNTRILSHHPELYMWDSCVYPTMPFSIENVLDSDNYLCNCRQVKIDLSSLSCMKNNTCPIDASVMIKSMFEHWDMLEIIYIGDSSDDDKYTELYLNETQHYNSKYLKILHLDEIRLTKLHDYSIENWENLEYLYLSHVYIDEWPTNFYKLNKIAFLKLHSILYLTELPPNLCNMYKLRALNVYHSPVSETVINTLPDCIVNLNELQSIIFQYALINSFPIELLRMESIEEIGFFVSNISLKSFNYSVNLNNHSNQQEFWSFDYNPTTKTTYSFVGSPLCPDTSDIDTSEYPDAMITFIEKTNACYSVCKDDALSVFFCTPLNSANGVCNQECNTYECYWDKGDCNQLCLYYYPDCDLTSMFDNRICDKECNYSVCNYDNYECIGNGLQTFNLSIFDKNETYCNMYNISDIYDEAIESELCEIDWINDGWCDNNCRQSEECFYDTTDCSCDQDTNCNYFYYAFQVFADPTIDNGKYITKTTFCSIWNVIIAYYGDSFVPILGNNCSLAFDSVDANNDTKLEINELVYIGAQHFVAYSLTEEKASQVNCSSCFA